MILAGLVLLAGAAGACGGSTPDGDASSPSQSKSSAGTSPLVGAYELTTTITKSSIPVNKPGPSSKRQGALYLTCAADDCVQLFQRVASDTSVQSSTVELAGDRKTLSGTHTRSGRCPAKGGGFKEAFAWSWHASGEDLEGTLVQTFTGCKLDGKTTYQARAVRTPGTALPYLDAAGSEAATTALNRYDATIAWVSDQFAACGRAGAGKQQDCFAALYRRWSQSVAPLAEAINRLAPEAKGSCSKVLDALKLDRLATTLESARDAYAAASAAAPGRNEAAVKAATRQHELLVSVALVCVPPERYDKLGRQGVLVMDVNSVVPPGTP